MFERVFVINLPERTDRRRQMERQLKLAHIEAEFFPAYKFNDNGPFHRVGSRGSFMSHLEVLRMANGARNVLIMEDDLNIVPFFWNRYSSILKPVDWAIFYLGYNGAKSSQSIGWKTLLPSDEIVGLHFHAVNGFAIPRIIKAMETFLTRKRDHPLGGPMPSDGALNVFRRQNPDLTCVAADPALGFQRRSRSDCAPKWFDKIPMVREAANITRRFF